MVWKLLLLALLIYPIIIFCGLISAFLLRLIQKLILSKVKFNEVIIKRSIIIQAGHKNNISIRLEDISLSFFRGLFSGLIVFSLAPKVGLYDLTHLLIAIILVQIIYIYTSWGKNSQFKNEIFLWLGDIPGTFIIFIYYLI